MPGTPGGKGQGSQGIPLPSTPGTRHKRKANDSVSIYAIREVVRYAMTLSPATKQEALCQLKFPNVLRSRRLYHWKQL